MKPTFLRLIFSLFFRKTLFALIFCLPAGFSFAADFYVSPHGNDANAGTKEKPFATLGQAKSAVENSIQNRKESVFTIWLADGVYEIDEPVVFKSTYFNEGIEVAIKAMKEANPVISGGVALRNWKKNGKGFWETKLAGDRKEWDFRELFINDKRATRARHPNTGYLHVKKVGADRRTNFYFEKGDFPIPKKPESVELVFLHDWSISRIAVKKIDSGEKQLQLVDSVGAKQPAFFNMDNWGPNPRYFLENAMEFLDADFEWFLDSEKHKVYLKLPQGVSPNNAQIIVPVARGLVEITGTEKQPATAIHFDGISFKYCSWEIPKMGYCGVQACFYDSRPDSYSMTASYNSNSMTQSHAITNKTNNKNKTWAAVPAAVKVEWAENCTFNNCTFAQLGTSGLWLATGTKNCGVNNSVFTDISANGIMVGEGKNRFIDGEVWWKKAPGQVAVGNKIENCKVTNCGVQFFGAIGIWCGITAETTIKNCEIANLPYSGVSIGWEWSPAETPCRNNVIDGNHIHHIMQILSDGGGIYMLGLQPGSKLINNQINDVKINAGRAESNGMFLDEGTTDVIVAGNLIYNIAKSPLRFHKATTNLVKENYLFCTGGNPPIRYNRTNEEDIKKVDNKVFSETDENYSKALKMIIAEWN